MVISMKNIKFSRNLKNTKAVVELDGYGWRLGVKAPVMRKQLEKRSLLERRSDYMQELLERIDKDFEKQG